MLQSSLASPAGLKKPKVDIIYSLSLCIRLGISCSIDLSFMYSNFLSKVEKSARATLPSKWTITL